MDTSATPAASNPHTWWRPLGQILDRASFGPLPPLGIRHSRIERHIEVYELHGTARQDYLVGCSESEGELTYGEQVTLALLHFVEQHYGWRPEVDQ